VLTTNYLIIGGGMAAAAAVPGIREFDPNGSIDIISDEADRPYRRPMLSKGLWQGKPLARVFYDTIPADVTFHLGRTAQTLDPETRLVTDDQGTTYRYDKLLIATGSSPRHLPINDEHSIYFRSLQDYHRLRKLAEPGRRLAVIGGGFIGSEIAAALASNGSKVTLIFPGQAIGESIFPADLAQSLNDRYRAEGIEVLAGERITAIEDHGGHVQIQTRSAGRDDVQTIVVDGVVTGIGTSPNVELAQAAGLKIDNGIVVDQFLRTSHEDIYAAGDVARSFQPLLGEWQRVEHEDQAKSMGRFAGQMMAGATEPYDHLPFFYSDLFDLGYEAVGELDSRLDTHADWVDPMREGVIYYLREGIVRGVLLWNVWDQVPTARTLIGQPLPSRDALSVAV
jgi:NADPH-dependent 2,4-dienoyl-CoA reductase/sulfur reductase-like enzyme